MRLGVDAVEPRDPNALFAESLFAVIGLSPLLDRKAPPIKIGKGDLAAAEALPAKVSRVVQRFISRSDFEVDSDDGPAFQMRRCVNLLADGPTVDEITGRIRGLPSDLALSFFEVAARAVTLLKDNAPALTVDTLSGPVVVQPGLVATSRFKRAWTACEDPMTVMRDFAAGTVSREQIKALEIAYPEIYDLARRQVLASVVSERTKVKSFALSPRKDRCLQIFMQAADIDQRLMNEIQSIYGGPDLDKNGEAIAPQGDGQAPEITGAKPTAAQELEGR